MTMRGRVLIVAGSDSGGGAGIQADIKTVTALGGYAATAITALTAQDTRGVHGVFSVDPAFIRLQMRVVLDDLGAEVVKTGMLATVPVIEAVAAELATRSGLIRVVDPVMVAKGGDPLLAADAVDALRRLIAGADLLTPNVPEAEVLSGMAITDLDGMRSAALSLLRSGPKAVLVKGGHLHGAVVSDLLVTGDGEVLFRSPRQETRHTHGTGCTLASAIATGLAQGLPLADAVERARRYLMEAIRTAPGYGSGHGPLNHGHTFDPTRL